MENYKQNRGTTAFCAPDISCVESFLKECFPDCVVLESDPVIEDMPPLVTPAEARPYMKAIKIIEKRWDQGTTLNENAQFDTWENVTVPQTTDFSFSDYVRLLFPRAGHEVVLQIGKIMETRGYSPEIRRSKLIGAVAHKPYDVVEVSAEVGTKLTIYFPSQRYTKEEIKTQLVPPYIRAMSVDALALMMTQLMLGLSDKRCQS